MRKLKSIILLLGMHMVVLTAYAQTITSIPKSHHASTPSSRREYPL